MVDSTSIGWGIADPSCACSSICMWDFGCGMQGIALHLRHRSGRALSCVSSHTPVRAQIIAANEYGVRSMCCHDCHQHSFCEMQGHDEIVWAVEVSGNRLFSASADKTIRVWDIETRRCIQVLEDHARPVLSLAVSGSYLFSGSYDYSIKVRACSATFYLGLSHHQST